MVFVYSEYSKRLSSHIGVAYSSCFDYSSDVLTLKNIIATDIRISHTFITTYDDLLNFITFQTGANLHVSKFFTYFRFKLALNHSR